MLNLMTRNSFHRRLLVFALATVFLNPGLLPFLRRSESLPPDSGGFSKSVQDGQTDVIRDVYVPNVLSLPVVQQPTDQPYYVSAQDGEITQFSIASQYGNIGLLAHNRLSGKFFSQLAIGEKVHLVYGDGREKQFVITQILRFQALQPESISSMFRNLDRDEVLSAGEVFSRAYVGGYHLVFQTCIEAQGNGSWGRLFVLAVPEK